MTRNEFLSSIAASMVTLGSSLAAIATSISSHPATGDEDFDPDGVLQSAADQLVGLAETAKSTADALNPATPGGVNDAAPDETGDDPNRAGSGEPIPGNGNGDPSSGFENPAGNQTSDSPLPSEPTVADTSGDTQPAADQPIGSGDVGSLSDVIGGEDAAATGPGGGESSDTPV